MGRQFEDELEQPHLRQTLIGNARNFHEDRYKNLRRLRCLYDIMSDSESLENYLIGDLIISEVDFRWHPARAVDSTSVKHFPSVVNGTHGSECEPDDKQLLRLVSQASTESQVGNLRCGDSKYAGQVSEGGVADASQELLNSHDRRRPRGDAPNSSSKRQRNSDS